MRSDVVSRFAAIMMKWAREGVTPYEASEAWGYLWGVGIRVGPGPGRGLRLAASAILGVLLGLVGYGIRPEVKREAGRIGGV